MSIRYVLALVALVGLAVSAGWWSRGWLDPDSALLPGQMASADGSCPGDAEPLYWKAPMDPTFVRRGPGKSPMGMDLVPECPPAGATTPEREGVIRIDPSVVQNIGVRSVRVERRDLARKIRALGRVAYDERRVTHVHTKVQGWVEMLRVDYVGQQVRRGEPLLGIYSPELVSTQEELLLAARYRDQTRKSPFPDVSESGESLFEAARRRLELWDVRPRDIERLLETGKIQKTLTLYAPTAGVVTMLGVRSGMEVQPNQNLYTIADLSKVWVLSEVYEVELPWVHVGQRGTVELSYLPGVSFSGEVTFVSPLLDPKTRTAQVRLELDNPEGHLKPEMFANTTIETDARPGVLVVPSEAVLRSGRRSMVMLDLGKGRFAPREVELGLDSGDGWTEVSGGLDEGDSVVVSSQFLLDSESRLQEVVRKLLSQPPPDEPAAQPEPAPPAMPSMPHEHQHGEES